MPLIHISVPRLIIIEDDYSRDAHTLRAIYVPNTADGVKKGVWTESKLHFLLLLEVALCPTKYSAVHSKSTRYGVLETIVVADQHSSCNLHL